MSENVLILLATIPGFALSFSVRGLVETISERRRLERERREA